MDLVLDELRDADSDALFAWINDPKLVEHSAVFAPVQRAEHDAWLAAVRADPDVAIFAVRDSGRLVGTGQLIRDGEKAELRIRIGETDARDRGLGTEAVRRLVAFGFGEMGLERIWLQVFKRNARAIRAYEKAGFAVCEETAESLVMGQGEGSTEPSSSER